MPADSTFMKPFVLNGIALKADEIEYSNPVFYKPDVVTDYALKFLNEKEDKASFIIQTVLQYNRSYIYQL